MKTRLLRRHLPAILALALSTPTLDAALPAVVDGQALPTLAPMVERVTPTVVNIATRGRVPVQHPLLNDPFFRQFFDVPPQYRRTQGLGSGVIIDAEHGYIVTNHHVIAEADDIQITVHDGRQFEAQVIGSDPDVDVAVLDVEADGLTDAEVADSDALRVGDFVVAIGNPFGLSQTVTSGIVSALGRSGLGIEAYENFIQTDASINPGNSGGALVNLRGELVGINTAILGPSGGNIGIGFAIPINMVREIAAQLIEHGEVRRGVLGIIAQDLTPALADAFAIERGRGVVIARVEPDSPAAHAGLAPGDVIVSLNGRRIEDAADLRNAIGLLTVGSRVRMEILREGRRHTVQAIVKAAALESIAGEELNPRLAGGVFGNIAQDSPLYGRATGVVVEEVARASPAALAGLLPGDVIRSVNQRPVEGLDDFAEAVRGASRLLLNVQRGGAGFFILLE
jgi:Do/DeqQ family serine protease